MRLIFFYRTFWYVYSICIRNSNIEIFTTSWRICGKYSYAYKLRATSETLITYRINILRNSDVFQAKATPKSRIADSSDTTRDIDVGQTAATIKSSIGNFSDTISDTDVGQTTAAIKSASAYASDTTRDVNAGQTAAARVFVCCFISMAYMLNGRKVKL